MVATPMAAKALRRVAFAARRCDKHQKLVVSGPSNNSDTFFPRYDPRASTSRWAVRCNMRSLGRILQKEYDVVLDI